MKFLLVVLLFLFPSTESVGSENHWNYGSGVGSKSHWNYGSGVGSKNHWNYGSGEGSKNHWNYGSGVTFKDNPMIDVCLGLRESGDTLPFCNYITPQ